jgi:hypothetical protein
LKPVKKNHVISLIAHIYENENKLTSKNSAPMDSTCSLAAARTSKARTMAPMFLAVWIAARPATPAPTTSTLAGGTLPAIVNWPAKNRGNAFAASTIAR